VIPSLVPWHQAATASATVEIVEPDGGTGQELASLTFGTAPGDSFDVEEPVGQADTSLPNLLHSLGEAQRASAEIAGSRDQDSMCATSSTPAVKEGVNLENGVEVEIRLARVSLFNHPSLRAAGVGKY
jgi:hypothetical protein